MPEAAANESLLYADDTCIVFQHESVTEIEKQLIRYILSLRYWFVGNELNIHFGQDKKNQYYLVLNINFEMLSPKVLSMIV